MGRVYTTFMELQIIKKFVTIKLKALNLEVNIVASAELNM